MTANVITAPERALGKPPVLISSAGVAVSFADEQMRDE
jgi:hypothetical protein